VRFHFAGKPGVCGDGAGMLGQRKDPGALPSDDDDFTFFSNSSYTMSGGHSERVARCVPGALQVSLTMRNGNVESVRTTAGPLRASGSSDITDLGRVSAKDAAAYLIGVAERESSGVAKKAMIPAVLADSAVVWPGLLRLARNAGAARDKRKNAIFWVGQIAAESVGDELRSFADDEGEDVEIRKHAVFALSQRPREEGIPALLQIARSSRSREVRKAALFWLAQSGDPRAAALFEQILLKN
jgi:HEAT repeat protein